MAQMMIKSPAAGGGEPYVTTAKFIEASSPNLESYNNPTLWATNGQRFTFAAFLKHELDDELFNSRFLSNVSILLAFRRFNESPPSTQRNSFLIYLTSDGGSTGWVGETYGADESGIEKGDWFAFMLSIDYSTATPTVEIWTHKRGDSAAIDINKGPLWAPDTGPIDMCFNADEGYDAVMGYETDLGNPDVDFDISEIFITDEAVDWSDPAIRAKYVDSSGKPVGLGADGSELTGTQPRYYAPGGDMSGHVGSEGNWTETGTITNSASSPSDPTEPPPAGPELVTNGTFTTNTDWTLGPYSTIAGGVCTIEYLDGISQSISISSGEDYIIEYEVTANSLSGGTPPEFYLDGTGFTAETSLANHVGTHWLIVTATSTNDLKFTTAGTAGEVAIDNVSVKQVL